MKQMLKYILAVVMENLKYAEAKHSVSVALNSGIILFVSSNLSTTNKIASFFASLSILFCGMSIAYGFLALMSREIKISKRQRIRISQEEINLVYFKDISSYAVTNYLDAIIKDYNFPKGYKPDGFEYDLARQIILNAKVTNIKFEYFNKSLKWLIIGIIFAVIMVAVLGLGV